MPLPFIPSQEGKPDTTSLLEEGLPLAQLRSEGGGNDIKIREFQKANNYTTPLSPLSRGET